MGLPCYFFPPARQTYTIDWCTTTIGLEVQLDNVSILNLGRCLHRAFTSEVIQDT